MHQAAQQVPWRVLDDLVGWGGWDLGFGVRGSGFRVQGWGLRVEGPGVRVPGSGYRGRVRLLLSERVRRDRAVVRPAVRFRVSERDTPTHTFFDHRV